jgi:heme-degrading monooxygenase HmoA
MSRSSDSPPDVTRLDAGTVLVNRWYVGTPERQHAGADALVAEWERTPWPDGFIAASCLLSTDGDTIVTYSQWTSDEAHRSFAQSKATPAPTTAGGSILEPAEPVRFRLRRSVVAPGGPQAVGCIVIPTFDVDGPERQRHIIDVVAGPPDSEPEAVPGLIAAHLHASTDGTRVINYAEWTDEDAHQRMVDATPTDDQAQWRNEITDTAGIRFTGYKRFALHQTLHNA